MSLDLKNEICKFYPCCSHGHYRSIICRKQNWLNCNIYKKLIESIDVIRVNNKKILQELEKGKIQNLYEMIYNRDKIIRDDQDFFTDLIDDLEQIIKRTKEKIL